MNIKCFILLITINLSCSAVHTIYVSGPPVVKNKRWFKESKVLYDAIKKEVKSNFDEIELFPKKQYRESIVRYDEIIKPLEFNKFLSKREIRKRFKNKERLLDDLVVLILNRHKELRDEFEGLDDKIHLMAHGEGGELLLMLKRSPYNSLIRSYVVFDGDESRYRTISASRDLDDSISTGTVSEADIALTDTARVIDLALKSNGNLVINFDMSQMLGSNKSKGHKAEIATLATAVVGLIAGILALL